MTPDQLREWNATRPFPHPNEAQEIIFEGHRCVVMDPECYEACFKQAESHAAALEEIERLKGDIRQMVENEADEHLAGYRELGAKCAALEERAEAERDALKRHAEEVKRDLAASVVKSAELEEENSKLRSALAIVHFKREPWQ